MRSRAALMLTAVVAGLAISAHSQDGGKAGEPAVRAVRVGTFDSRLVAIAYARSELFQGIVRKMHDDLAEAKRAGDQETIDRLTARGPALQEHIERQSFSTWPIADILETVQDRLPGVAKEAGVDVIVSKWHVAYRNEGVETVDVTAALVNLFDPTPETRKVLASMGKKEPVPLDQLPKHTR